MNKIRRTVGSRRDTTAASDAYFRIDETIVWDVVLTKLPPLEREVRRIMGG